MPLKLVSPRPGKTPFWSVRGTYLGVYVDRSTKATNRATAAKFLKLWRAEIESGAITHPGERTLLDAAVDYMAAHGDDRFLAPVLESLGRMPIASITQEDVDQAAIALYPRASAATRNRQVYTPVSAILKYARVDWPLRRPKGWRGNSRTLWLKPYQAFRLFSAADGIDTEFGIFLRLLCYTGLRLSEALALRTDSIELADGFAYVPTTKAGTPRGVFLPPVIVAALGNHPKGLERPGRIFRFRKNGRLYALLAAAKKAAGGDVGFTTFHVLRHTWATWMRRYGGLDTKGLVATGAWSDETSASRYAHAVVSEESRKAIRLPVENPWTERKTPRKRA